MNHQPPIDRPSLLLLILDLHPLSWALSASPGPSQPIASSSGVPPGDTPAGSSTTSDATAASTTSDPLTLMNALSQIMVFLNAHLASRWGNELVVYAALSGGKSELLFSSHNPSPSLSYQIPPNSYEPFHTMNHTIQSRLKQILKDQEEYEASRMELDTIEDGVKKKDRLEEEIRGGPAIVPALLKALCHINRLHTLQKGGDSISNLQSSTTGHHLSETEIQDSMTLQSRVMVVNNTPERGAGGGSAGGGGGGAGGGNYVGLMNGVFAAQKRKTPIDVINLSKTDSIFLQQASHLTHGIYYRVPKRAGLLTYLNTIFLAPPSLRPSLGLPPQDKVDFRAVCFCHQKVVDIGFVCSVCLSIFCKPNPICSTCKSRFPPTTVTQLKKSLPAALLIGNGTPNKNGAGGANGSAKARSSIAPGGGVNGVAAPSPLAQQVA